MKKKEKKGKKTGEDDREPISYKKLIKHIETYHPVNPQTKERFKINERITVKDFNSKLYDAFYCFKVKEQFLKLKKMIWKKFTREAHKV